MKKLIILFTVISFSVSAQNNMQNFISYVNSLSTTNEKNTAVDSFMNFAAPSGFPYIEGNQANFIYRGSISTAAVAGDFNGWGTTAMNKLNGTNFFYYSRSF